jgi:hypothetical protein
MHNIPMEVPAFKVPGCSTNLLTTVTADSLTTLLLSSSRASNFVLVCMLSIAKTRLSKISFESSALEAPAIRSMTLVTFSTSAVPNWLPNSSVILVKLFDRATRFAVVIFLVSCCGDR